jgi:hypothetical protein
MHLGNEIELSESKQRTVKDEGGRLVTRERWAGKESKKRMHERKFSRQESAPWIEKAGFLLHSMYKMQCVACVSNTQILAAAFVLGRLFEGSLKYSC